MAKSFRQTLKIPSAILLIILCICPGTQLPANPPRPLYPILHNYAQELYKDYGEIPTERKFYIESVAEFMKNNKLSGKESEILFVGCNQSTRSIMIQAWAYAAAHYYGFDEGAYFSGGMFEGPIKTQTIQALERAGFIVYKIEENGTVFYQIKYSFNLQPQIFYPKKIADRNNPANNFMSVIVCQHAAQNLPVIKGSYNRLELFYEDPLGYEGSELEQEKYDAVCRQIALEMFYLFQQLKHI